MPIEVTVDNISLEILNEILDYYNTNKSETDEPLELLDRYEDGFKIKIKSKENEICDPNEKIKQLRWNKKRLTSDKYIGFTEKEEFLLYESMVYVLKGDVLYQEE